MKSGALDQGDETVLVTPFTGVWIEMIRLTAVASLVPRVTPFTGVWIEIF